MDKFKGIVPALYTHFEKDGALKTSTVAQHVEFLLEKGCTGLFVGGSTGEGFFQNVDERKRYAEAAVSAARGAMDVVLHVGALDLRVATELARHANRIGCAGVSSVLPFYYPYLASEVRNYYDAVSAAADLPVIVYFLGRTGALPKPEEFLETFDGLENLWGVKFTHPDLYQMQMILILSGGRLKALGGYDQMALPSLVMGAIGVIGNNYNHIPDPYVKIYRAFSQGRLQDAVHAQREANTLLSALKKHGNYDMGKAVLRLRGIDVGGVRAPFINRAFDRLDAIREILSRHGIETV